MAQANTGDEIARKFNLASLARAMILTASFPLAI
jgi:hypothetical protein